MRRLEFSFHLAQFGLQQLTNRLPKHRKPSASSLAANVRKAEEREGLGLPLTTPLAIDGCVAAELHQTGLFRMQLQSKLAQALHELLPEPLGLRLVLESEHDVIGETDDNHVAAHLLAAPCPDPKVEYMKDQR
jgi:hypothetical protein